MKNLNYKVLIPHLVAVVVFMAVTLVFFYPIVQGKILKQGDIIQFRGMSREIIDWREKTGEEALWTNSMFGGMPAYQISVEYPSNLIRHVDAILSFNLPKPANFLFLSLIGFYILLLAFRVDPWLAIAGAFAFAFSTYFFIIEAAGHNTKAHAMAYMAPLIAGIVLAFRGKVWLGAALTGLFLALQLYTNHLQITYYTLIIVVVYGIYELVHFAREKRMVEYVRILGILILPVILAVGMNITNLWLTWEYSHYSTRGKSELTIKQDVQTTGLDKDYILNDYSYGIAETMNLFIPDFKGRSSSHSLGNQSEVFRVLRQAQAPNALAIAQNLPTYWGDQRFTAGPVYIGATVIFLFVFGLFLLRGRLKWWLLTATILSILLAWGRNFPLLSEFFIDFIPGYNKFRTVSMILVIAELTIPLLALLAMAELFREGIDRKRVFRSLKYALYVTGGIALFFLLLPGALLSFSGGADAQLLDAGYPEFIVDALKTDRQHMLRQDAFRTLMFVILTAGLVLLFNLNKVNRKLLVAGLAVLFLLDLWVVGRRFLNDSSYVSKRENLAVFQPSQADMEILSDPDPSFRVFNLTRSPFNDALTSYHHKSVGGYHGAKMGRYQDVIETYLFRLDMDILNMLNTKYFISAPENQGAPMAQMNPEALGNAWFVETARIVENADEELEAIGDFDPAREMILDKRFEELVRNIPQDRDTAALIQLESYAPNHLAYRSVSETDQLAVFSEIFYSKGWQAIVSGEPAEHFRVNYLLRGMVVPGGEHVIEFKFRPAGYFTGERISLISSLIFLLSLILIFYLEIRKSSFENS
jgi:hypothetical protein